MKPARKRQRQEKENGFDTLPDELLQIILQQCDPRIARGVCVRWRNAVDSILKCKHCYSLRLASCRLCGKGCCVCSSRVCDERVTVHGKMKRCGKINCNDCIQQHPGINMQPCSGCSTRAVCMDHCEDSRCRDCDEVLLCWECINHCEECTRASCDACVATTACCGKVLCSLCTNWRGMRLCGEGCGKPVCGECCSHACTQCMRHSCSKHSVVYLSLPHKQPYFCAVCRRAQGL